MIINLLGYLPLNGDHLCVFDIIQQGVSAEIVETR